MLSPAIAMEPRVSAPMCGRNKLRIVSRLGIGRGVSGASLPFDAIVPVCPVTDGWQSGWMSCTARRLHGATGVSPVTLKAALPNLKCKEKRDSIIRCPLKPKPKAAVYLEYTKCPRRFCCQHCSFDSVQ